MRDARTRHGVSSCSAVETIYQNYAEEEFYVTVLDADTLLLQVRLKDTDGVHTTSTQIFSRF